MRRLNLGLLLSLLAAAAMVGSFAFKSANVTSMATMTVSSTNLAQLALVPGAGATITPAGILNVTFQDQQPNSTYTYNGPFQAQNRRPVTILLKVNNVSGESPNGAHLIISARANDTGATALLWNEGPTANSLPLNSSEFATFTVSVRLDPGASPGAQHNLAITLQGQ